MAWLFIGALCAAVYTAGSAHKGAAMCHGVV